MNLFSYQKTCSIFIVTISKRCKSSGKKSEPKMKVFLQKRNPLTGSTEWDIGLDHDQYDYHQEIARSAFADMLHDTERNKMYYRALQMAIEKMHRDGKKANVLDIGTGTGLLSMMAAKCGADTITACEAFKPMAECCLQILERNGVADKIKVIPKRSTEITVGEGGDMEQKANILVTEVFDTELIGEGALPTFTHAHKYLLEDDCIVVPDSAVIYAQVVECPFLQRWNKLEDVTDPELGLLLETPQKMRACGGAAAAHDVQLSQLARRHFRELSAALPALRFDWSGRSALPPRRLLRQQFTARRSGPAHAVFVWWDLNMDPEGSIVLSCAPWWSHPAADAASARPAGSVPWRDHWLQAVYYLPPGTSLVAQQEATLVSCQDEYSLWFYMEDRTGAPRPYRRPVCDCGLHMAWSRTHVAHVNDEKRGRALRQRLKREITRHSVVLDLNGSSLLGLVAAKLANKVYILETSQFNINILQDYMKANNIKNVEFLTEINKDSDVLKEITNVVFDPIRSSSILPWEDLKSAYILHGCKERLAQVPVIPASFSLWAVPVQFLDLHKIREPVRVCEGFDVTIFDRLVERSRALSDAALEAQPLWEYPARAAGARRRLLAVDFSRLRDQYALDGTFTMSNWSGPGDEPEYPVNGFAVWAEWGEGGGGPTAPLHIGALIEWDPHTRQAVTILKKCHNVKASGRWSYRLACDLRAGRLHIHVGLGA